MLSETCSKVFYPTFNLEKALDLLENGKCFSKSQKVMLNLALDLYRGNYKGDSIMEVFSCFDEKNSKVVLEAIKIHFSIV